MDVCSMGEMVHYYIKHSLAKSTLRTYESGKRRYIRFCMLANCAPLPVSERKLCEFVANTAKEGLKHQTIKSYLSAVRHLQILVGLGDPFLQNMPILEYVLRGVKSVEVKFPTSPQRTRLPITPDILRKVRLVLEKDKMKYDHVMLWAAYCTAFFGFLRSGEVTVPSRAAYDPGEHLSYGDITFNSQTQPTVAQVNIKASKTDPFRAGVMIYLGRTNCELCPVTALIAYYTIRGTEAGPFFQFRDGSPLSREKLVEKLRESLTEAGVDPTKFAGHSFRIGAASTARANGVQDSMIQTLGRWRSAAYLRYVRIPRQELASISKTLVS